jgi:hypothetical protein
LFWIVQNSSRLDIPWQSKTPLSGQQFIPLTPMPGAGTTNDENPQAGVVESHKKGVT